MVKNTKHLFLLRNWQPFPCARHRCSTTTHGGMGEKGHIFKVKPPAGSYLKVWVGVVQITSFNYEFEDKKLEKKINVFLMEIRK